MGGKPRGKNYKSKGERPSLSRKVKNSMRRDFTANPSLKSIFQRSEHRSFIISRPKDPKVSELRKKYLDQDSVKSRAGDLFEKYKEYGVTWSACVQAVKTDWISNFEEKWNQIKLAKTRVN